MFDVPLGANKQQIIDAVESQLKSKSAVITTAVQSGKSVRFSRGKRRYPGTTNRQNTKKPMSDFQKAIVSRSLKPKKRRRRSICLLKQYSPTTPGRRGMTSQDMSDITTRKPLKSLVKSKKQQAGRNNTGRITTRHRGGGVRRHYRLLNHRLAADLKLNN
jgi:ribosomal protein L23